MTLAGVLPSPEFLSFADAQLEILPSPVGRGQRHARRGAYPPLEGGSKSLISGRGHVQILSQYFLLLKFILDNCEGPISARRISWSFCRVQANYSMFSENQRYFNTIFRKNFSTCIFPCHSQ